MKKYLELLESELGYAEKASGHTKFGEWYGRTVEFDSDYSKQPWCDMFLSWAAHKLGYEEWIGQFAWTVAHAKWFKKQGAWGNVPKPGAFVFYDWSGSKDLDRIDHVGIVTKVEGGRIHTIEGNIDGGVAKRKVRDTDKVVGYGYPEEIKARLEKAEKQAEANREEGTLPQGTPFLSEQGTTNELLTHIPRVEPSRPAEGPAASRTAGPARPAQQSDGRAAEPGQTVERATTTQQAAPRKPGKHAKPVTADTQEATTQPMPVVADTPTHAALPAVDSPALVGSALVAALAVLAVATTKQMRVRLASAGPLRDEAPVRGRRRRRRGAPRPATAALAEVAPATATPATAVPAVPAAVVPAPAAAVPSAPAAESPRGPRMVRIEDTDAFAAIVPETIRPSIPGEEPVGVTTASSGPSGPDPSNPFEPFDVLTPGPQDAEPFDFFTPKLPPRRTRFRPLDAASRDLAAEATVSALPPIDRDVLTPRPYRGRRRRSEQPADLQGFRQDAPLRGRRHRAPAQRPFLEAFAEAVAPDVPLRGRRHRREAPVPAMAGVYRLEEPLSRAPGSS
ncbi:CHAP domain-containing protein [Thermoactinospora rubra]|uniref:CHAP domain-containing protein n=1 Tax=Thermoactinospora rubra TaxID=1088767 RepID=UPI001F0A2559|nr:CHAP domain-containing protein [Thermoactinospora rubra]